MGKDKDQSVDIAWSSLKGLASLQFQKQFGKSWRKRLAEVSGVSDSFISRYLGRRSRERPKWETINLLIAQLENKHVRQLCEVFFLKASGGSGEDLADVVQAWLLRCDNLFNEGNLIEARQVLKSAIACDDGNFADAFLPLDARLARFHYLAADYSQSRRAVALSLDKYCRNDANKVVRLELNVCDLSAYRLASQKNQSVTIGRSMETIGLANDLWEVRRAERPRIEEQLLEARCELLGAAVFDYGNHGDHNYGWSSLELVKQVAGQVTEQIALLDRGTWIAFLANDLLARFYSVFDDHNRAEQFLEISQHASQWLNSAHAKVRFLATASFAKICQGDFASAIVELEGHPPKWRALGFEHDARILELLLKCSYEKRFPLAAS